MVFLIVILISFIPIAVWWYFFQVFWWNDIHRKDFFLWIFSWMLAVVPLLVFQFSFFESFSFFNIFSQLSPFIRSTQDHILWFPMIRIFLAFFFTVFLLSGFSFLVFFYQGDKISKSVMFLKNTIFLFFFSFIFLVFLFFLREIIILLFWEMYIPQLLENAFFSTFTGMVMYYMISSFLEEHSKFFCFVYSHHGMIYSFRQGIIGAIFVALGFSFFENILYVYNIYETYWLSWKVVGVYFIRNIFSIILHLLCGSIIAFFFLQMYVNNYVFSRKNIYSLWGAFFSAIILHGLFNILLTLNIMVVFLVYSFLAYVILSYFFQFSYDERKEYLF